jgi:diaminohydroxyphosphoribosylaminopyrimidine deaminase/5-amino-6-(5-phosphoribosylamino)uracil reductase
MTPEDSRFLERAVELAERGRGTAHPNPVVGAVVVRDGEVVGEGYHVRRGEPHAEPIALAAAGDRARGATIYVSLEPCTHHGRTPPCVDACIAAGVSRVVAASLDPNPEVSGGPERLAAAGIAFEAAPHDSAVARQARRQNEAWRTWIARGRPFVTLKCAMTLDGRVAVPGRRWVSGPESRLLVHVLRASSDAVGVGMGTVRLENPRLDAREVPVARQPRRLAFGRGPLPEGSELELLSGPLADELAALAAAGVQSLLLEGGPTLAAAFLEQGLVDKLLLFVAPTLAGEGPPLVGPLGAPLDLARLESRKVGADVLLTAYVAEL